jgi:putative endonuclease
MGRKGYVYILASQKNGTLYTGVTSDLAGRLEQHKRGVGSKFAAKYGVTRLVWFDEYDLVVDAIAREKSDQEVAASMEDQADRGKQSELA